MGYLVYMIFMIILIASILIPVLTGVVVAAVVVIIALSGSSKGKKVKASSDISSKTIEKRRRYMERLAVEKDMTPHEKTVAGILGAASSMLLIVVPVAVAIHAFSFYARYSYQVYDEASGLMRRIPDHAVMDRMDLMVVVGLVSVLTGSVIWLIMAFRSKARTLVRYEGVICFSLMPVILSLLLAVSLVRRGALIH